MALIDKLKAIAEGFRASRGTTKEYSLDEMAVLAAEKGEAVPDGTNVTFGNVQQDGNGIPEGKASYNGVVLPKIPEDVLAQYPYAWIRKNTTSGYYDLFISDEPFYFQSVGIYPGSGTAAKLWYRVAINNAENVEEWEDNSQNNTFDWWGIDSARPVLWSNHDIPNGSATATDIYFFGSEPVTGGETALVPAEREEAYSIKSEDLNTLGAISQSVAGQNALMTIGEMIYALNKAKFIPQGTANSSFSLNFESNAGGVLKEG